jgi:vancomycin permeability regulator SanA
MKLVKKSLKLLAIVIIIGLIWTTYIQWKIHSVQEMPLSSEPSDVCIILGAALWNDKPSPALRERLNVAIELYEEGHCQYVIATGGLIRYMMEKGIPLTNMRSESEARSTYENLLFSHGIME